MKTTKLFSLLLILGVAFLSCQKEEISEMSGKAKKSIKRSGLRDAANCSCVTDYSESLVTYSQAPDIKVEVWNDATTIYYKVYRLASGNIGNLWVDDVSQGGSPSDEYTFTKSAVASCAEVTTKLRVVGIQDSPAEFNVVYKMVTLCISDCLAYTYDTGFGGENKGGGKAWWYYYTASSGSKTVYAGKNKPAGTVVVDGSGNYTISLAPGWELDPGASESVKIQGYDSVPASRPAAGLFSGSSSYKGTSSIGSVSPKPYYVIHLDLRQCTSFNDPT